MSFERVLAEPGVVLKYLAANDLLSACEPLSADRFARFCADRGLHVDVDRLERLEKLGVFFPVLRVRYPKIKIKVERVDESHIRTHGMLKDGETWDGELREENSRLSWRPDWIGSWIDQGLAWDPRSRPFEPWSTFGGSNFRADVQNFYSIFQCYPLEVVLTQLTTNVWVEQFAEPDANDPHKVADNVAEYGRVAVEGVRKHRRGEDAALLAQILSARYYFHTRGDQRTITVSSPTFEGWDWWEFSQKWDTNRVAADLGLSADDVKKIHDDVRFMTKMDDPLSDWYELVSFVAVRKKEKLKGAALFAQLGYSIEHMLRLFYRDLTGHDLPRPDEGWGWNRDQKYGEGVTANTLRHLEYLANEYNLNPRPKVILIVEGDGEAAELPRLASSLFGADFATAAVEVRALGSVDEFTGDKRIDVYGALEKLIDDYHARQTLVIIVLDNENRAQTVRQRLIGARSRLVSKRKLTKAEYIKLWRRNFEFDNFSDDEIAEALTAVAEDRYVFAREEITACRTRWDERKADYLSRLYEDRLNYGLNKRSLVARLIDRVIANQEAEVSATEDTQRPVVRIVREVIELAALNHQPESDAGRVINQKTGYFGAYDPD